MTQTKSGTSSDVTLGPRLEIELALISHLTWRRHLIAGLSVDNVRSAAEARLDDQCPLGIWLLKNKSRYQDTLIYHEVCALHRGFHIEASCLVMLSDVPALAAEQWARMDRRSDELVAALARWRESFAPNSGVAGYQSVHVFEGPTRANSTETQGWTP